MNLNLAYLWFCKLSLTDPVPDHSTFSKNRHGRFRESGLLRKVFETVLARCIADGGEAFAVDASIIKADANREKGGPGADGLPAEILCRRAVQEYLQTLDEAAFGGSTPVEPKFLSPVDPAARWTRTYKDGAAKYSYLVNYLIDCEHAVIMDVEGTTAVRTAEVHSTRVMLDRVEARNRIKPQRLSGDTAYVQPRCRTGWSTSVGSSRTFRSGTRPLAGMVASNAPTSSTQSAKSGHWSPCG